MYIFKYEATSDPEYYNKFPLVFMLRKRQGLYEGISFHYLNISQRKQLFNTMKPLFGNSEKTIEIFAKTLSKMLFASKKWKMAKVSFRKYKQKNIRSAIIEVHPDDWESALEEKASMFITHEGKRMNKMIVWKDSLVKQRQ